MKYDHELWASLLRTNKFINLLCVPVIVLIHHIKHVSKHGKRFVTYCHYMTGMITHTKKSGCFYNATWMLSIQKTYEKNPEDYKSMTPLKTSMLSHGRSHIVYQRVKRSRNIENSVKLQTWHVNFCLWYFWHHCKWHSVT